MNTPQKILKEYLNGINQVIDSNPPEEELKEITRMKLMFASSIELIDYFSGKATYYSNNKRLTSTIKSLEEELKFEKKNLEKLKNDINTLVLIKPHQTHQTI
jgi:flagellar motility protein MotE (MotC chaperone)